MSRPPAILNPRIPPSLQSRLLFFPDNARNMGVNFASGKGTGKSRAFGRGIVWLDFVRGMPLVVFDPRGPTIDNFLDKVRRLPEPLKSQLLARIVLVDMSGKLGRVVPFPLYRRNPQETLFDVAQRFPEIIRKLEPHLQTASIQGWNALYRTAIYAGMVLTALDLQITEMEELLRVPATWLERIRQGVTTFPDLAPALVFFEDLARASASERNTRTTSLLTQIAIFSDPTMAALFGANTPGLPWEAMLAQRMAVLVDSRDEWDMQRTRFKFVTVFSSFMEYIMRRGAGRQHTPVSLFIDELSYLLGLDQLGHNPIADDMDELMNRTARNDQVWLNFASQGLHQFDQRTKRSLLSMGTQIFGSTTDPDVALLVARQFARYNPLLVKKWEPMYSSFMGMSNVIDYRSVEFTPDEQLLLASYRLLDLPRFHFLVAAATEEGTMPTRLRRVSIERLDQGQFVDEEAVAALREQLAVRSGRSIPDVLAEIARRRQLLCLDTRPAPVVRMRKI